MPTDSDVAVRAFRRWFNSRGGGGVTWAKVRKRRKGGKNGRDDSTLFCAHTTLGSKLRFCRASRATHRRLGALHDDR